MRLSLLTFIKTSCFLKTGFCLNKKIVYFMNLTFLIGDFPSTGCRSGSKSLSWTCQRPLTAITSFSVQLFHRLTISERSSIEVSYTRSSHSRINVIGLLEEVYLKNAKGQNEELRCQVENGPVRKDGGGIRKGKWIRYGHLSPWLQACQGNKCQK